MSQTIRVAILEDHPAIVDGYAFRLQGETDIQLVATIDVGEDLPKALEAQAPVHVLILDVGVPTSASNGSPYPILYLLPQFLQRYPDLRILVISMHTEQVMIKALIDAGASGYVFKDDREALQKFPSVIRSIASGGMYFSRAAHKIVMRQASQRQMLSARQMEVLSLCAAYPEKTTAEIADILTLAHATVRNTLSVLYARLGVRGRTAATAKAREMGLIADVNPAFPLSDASKAADLMH